MPKYTYPCFFTRDEEYGGWTAEFPDWQGKVVGCTCGKSWQQVLYMADDLLNLMCMDCEDDNESFPSVVEHDVPEGTIIRLVSADTDKYRKECLAFKKVGRWRMAEKARRRYWYSKGPQSPEDENVTETYQSLIAKCL